MCSERTLVCFVSGHSMLIVDFEPTQESCNYYSFPLAKTKWLVQFLLDHGYLLLCYYWMADKTNSTFFYFDLVRLLVSLQVADQWWRCLSASLKRSFWCLDALPDNYGRLQARVCSLVLGSFDVRACLWQKLTWQS